MQVRSDMMERDDLEMRAKSVKEARNMRPLATGVAEQRPGLEYLRNGTGVRRMVEIQPQDGVTRGLLIGDDYLAVCDEDANILWEITSTPWDDAEAIWIEPFREETYMGGFYGISKLTYTASTDTYSFGDFEFDDAPGGEKAQPYWVYNKNTSIRPSARTGLVSVVASADVFFSGHVGQRIRYNNQEMTVLQWVGPRFVYANVVDELPPSYDITVTDASGFKVNEVIVGQDTNYQGIIRAINGNVLSVVTLELFEGPDVAEDVSGPSSTSEVTAKTEISPLGSTIWDEPLMSPVYGYPRSAATVAGRLVFLNFTFAPAVIAASSARSVTDWKVGAEDDDAIAREVGGGRPQFRHAIDAGDLLLFSDRGCYLVPIRDSGLLTPSTFNAVLFDERGASTVRPVRVEDGVIFVEANNETVSAALLDGNIYLKWSVRPLTLFHNVTNAPASLCGPALWAASEKYMMVVNGDGTMAVVSYNVGIGADALGFAPWETQGLFKAVSPMFGRYWAIVWRTINNVVQIFIERFDEALYLDAVRVGQILQEPELLEVNGEPLLVNGETLVIQPVIAKHLALETVSVYDGAYLGDFAVAADGSIAGAPEVSTAAQLGFKFTSRLAPWPAEVVDSERNKTYIPRVTRFMVKVQDSQSFEIVCNGRTRSVGGYEFGDDLSEPLPTRTKTYRASVFGRREEPDLAAVRTKPGPFRILATSQEVTY